MTGRDPHEQGRTATPLELMFDLTFVIAFGTAADDWLYRLTTMLQMVGVLVLALGLQDMFESLAEGEHVDNRVMVLGYVVMRVPMLFQWWRAGRADPSRASACRSMMVSLLVAQVGWVALALLDLDVTATLVGVLVLVAIELAGPVRAESVDGGTPWHPHHVAERYGLLVIITLGEGLLGTTAALKELIDEAWTLDVAVLGLAGVALTFGMYWIYFVVPNAELLHERPERSFGWGYGQIPLFGAAVAVGAGLHAAAYLLAGESTLSLVGTVLSVAVPLAVYVVAVFALWGALTRSLPASHLLLLLGSAAVIAVSLLLAAAGVSLSWCLLVLAMTPWVTVVAHEARGIGGPVTRA